MNKKELTAGIVEKTGISKKDADAVVAAALELITDSLKAGNNVQIVGFGALSVVSKPEHTVRNPITGEEMKAPASRSVRWKCGKALKESVNE